MATKIEGRGNGIKTNVVNMVDIAKALARPASYITKYFGCELGAQSKFDEKTLVSLVNGAHDTPKLAQLLENFIKKYVQCYGCGNPETEVIITKIQTIQLKCAACGFLSDVDMRDKLTTFILKHPPEQKKGGKDKKAMRRAEKERLKEGEAADEELKKLKKEAKKKTAHPSSKAPSRKKAGSDEDKASPPGSQVDETEPLHEEEEVEEDDVQWQTDTSREAAQKRIQEQLSAATAEMVMLATDEPEEKPKEKPKEKKVNGVDDPQAALVKKLKVHFQKGGSPEETKAILGGATKEKTDALFAALFDGSGKGFAKEAEKWIKHLAVTAEDEAGQLRLLQGFESFGARAGPEAVKETALVLKLFYDEDIVEEEVIVAWSNAGPARTTASQFWKNVRPFVEWLQNAESESE